ncbi:MAG: phosphoenolpyruvate--protein phosphotransferase [Blastocatellia bacterium]|nr:phosphoenolpyruvate--protein phosphotransferase [Blastocatellia bacterium]
MSNSSQQRVPAPPRIKPEIRLRARAVSRGATIGRAVLLHGARIQFFRIDLKETEVAAEIARFRVALDRSLRQLSRLLNDGKGVAHSAEGIFDTHRLILSDAALAPKIEASIATQRVNAEWAVKSVMDSYSTRYKSIADEHLRERYIDLDDISDRLLRALGGAAGTVELEKGSIIIAKELTPSTLMEFSRRWPTGLITEHGGWTSHTFILAREINIPAVTGLKKAIQRFSSGDTVVVDGYNGLVVINPNDETLAKYRVAAAQFQEVATDDPTSTDSPLKTLDGRRVVIRSNSDLPQYHKRAMRFGAEGVGLYRSEILFNHFKGHPTEVQQFNAYKEIADAAGDDGVRIRTFDIGLSQLNENDTDRERNPALGLRAIRLGLAYPKYLRTQIRSLLRASAGRKIDIIIPMVSGLAEIRAFKAEYDRERIALIEKKTEIGDPRIGAMIEIPSSVLLIRSILKEVDLICLGTNDLVQYLTAVDRDNESVASWFRTLHPAVIQAVGTVISAAADAGKQAVVCGEMAGSPFYTPILIGLGATDLSMNANSISRVRRVIAGLAFDEARELMKKVEECKTSEDIETELTSAILSRWQHLYPANFRRSRKI